MSVFSRSPRGISFMVAALLGVCTLVNASPVRAENWPARPIKIIVPFAAGGAVDLVARLLQNEMGKELGATVIVENRAGGAGVPASEALVHAAPDGYTIALMSSNYASNAVMQNLSFDTIKDITPIAKVIVNTVLILVPADSPIHSLGDLVAQAKAKPGTISYGTPGFATAMQFAGELLKVRAGINIVHVPYRGAGPALNDLLGKQIPVAILGIGPAIPHIRAGKIRPIAITTEKRTKSLPDVPTVAESGYPGFSSGEWFALIAPKGLPPEITKKLHDAAAKAIMSPSIADKLDKVGLEPTTSTPEELRAFLISETQRIRETADKAHMLDQKK